MLSALAEPLGAVLGLFAVEIAPSLNADFLSFAAGAMVSVSLDGLYPMARRYRRPGRFGMGMLLSLLVYVGLLIMTRVVGS